MDLCIGYLSIVLTI